MTKQKNRNGYTRHGEIRKVAKKKENFWGVSDKVALDQIRARLKELDAKFGIPALQKRGRKT